MARNVLASLCSNNLWQAMYLPGRWQGGKNAFSGGAISASENAPSKRFCCILADFLWLASGRQQHPGPPLKLECLGIARP